MPCISNYFHLQPKDEWISNVKITRNRAYCWIWLTLLENSSLSKYPFLNWVSPAWQITAEKSHNLLRIVSGKEQDNKSALNEGFDQCFSKKCGHGKGLERDHKVSATDACQVKQRIWNLQSWWTGHIRVYRCAEKNSKEPEAADNSIRKELSCFSPSAIFSRLGNDLLHQFHLATWGTSQCSYKPN